MSSPIIFYFTSGGSESIEVALRFARVCRHGKGTGKYEIILTDTCEHDRFRRVCVVPVAFCAGGGGLQEKEIAWNTKRLRLQDRLSIEELTKRSGPSKSHLRKIENSETAVGPKRHGSLLSCIHTSGRGGIGGQSASYPFCKRPWDAKGPRMPAREMNGNRKANTKEAV